MKPVIKQENAIYYVDQSDFIIFVEQNSDYEWDEICDLQRDTFNDEGKTFYFKKPTSPEHYNEFTIKWVGEFMDAHPFMERIVFVFND